jgi:salicylate hydroxylase
VNTADAGTRIAVIGAGIGGLTLAIALRRYGISVDIYEQTSELREVGAAVALSANATRFFEQFGLTPRLASHWFEVSALIFRDPKRPRDWQHPWERRTGRVSEPRPLGIHRADLQAVLSEAAGLVPHSPAQTPVDIDDTGARTVVRFDDGTSDADLVIGADARSFVVLDARL